jgi:hypothetical protein
MNEIDDHYRILDLSPEATAEQVKSAYHRAAKRAHPDAGGSASLMGRVNEAYRVLSDPVSRREYDAHRHQPPAPWPSPEVHAAQPTARRPSDADIAHHRQRIAAARTSAWQIFKTNAVMALLLGIISVFYNAQTTEVMPKVWMALLSSVPVYGTFIGVVFLINPRLRLDLHDLVADTLHRRGLPLTRAELKTLLGLALLYVPIAAVWTIILLVTVRPI